MAKSRADVEAVVKQLLQEFVGSGETIAGDDKPISGLGLTSLDGVDFACELEKKLGCPIPAKMNPFVKDGNAGERSVSEIVDVVASLPVGVQEGTP